MTSNFVNLDQTNLPLSQSAQLFVEESGALLKASIVQSLKMQLQGQEVNSSEVSELQMNIKSIAANIQVNSAFSNRKLLEKLNSNDIKHLTASQGLDIKSPVFTIDQVNLGERLAYFDSVLYGQESVFMKGFMTPDMLKNIRKYESYPIDSETTEELSSILAEQNKVVENIKTLQSEQEKTRLIKSFQDIYKGASRRVEKKQKNNLSKTTQSVESSNKKPTPPTNKRLKLLIHKVVCVDETWADWLEWIGSDAIQMSGVAVSLKGTGAREKKIQKLKEIFIGEFDDGKEKNYGSNPLTLWDTSLNNIQYPAEFSCAVAISEKDFGGFASFLSDLYKTTSKYVDKYAEEAIRKGLGLEKSKKKEDIASIIIQAIVKVLFTWIIDLFKDDVFEPKPVHLYLDSPSASMGGKLKSPTRALNFTDHEGHYKVYYSWEIVR